MVLATPAVRLLKNRFPQADIHFFTEKKCAPVLEHHPCLSRIWAFDKAQYSNLIGEFSYYTAMAREEFDLVVDFQQLPRCRWATAFSGAPIRLSYPPPWYKRLIYTHWVNPAENCYAAKAKASLLAPLGIAWNGEKPEMFLTQKEMEQARSFLHQLGVTPENQLITIDPTHRRETRRWPAEHFGRLIHLKSRQLPEARFLILFGPGERPMAEEVARSANLPHQCLIPDVMLSLREMAAVIKLACLHVGNCSAPRHIAVAVDTPTLVVMGSTSTQAWTFPNNRHHAVILDLPCQPCERDTCDHIRCLKELTPEVALKKMTDLLNQDLIN